MNEQPTDDGGAVANRDVRGRIEEALEEFLDAEQIRQLMDEVLRIEKEVWGRCRNCDRSVKVAVPDAKAVVSAA